MIGTSGLTDRSEIASIDAFRVDPFDILSRVEIVRRSLVGEVSPSGGLGIPRSNVNYGFYLAQRLFNLSINEITSQHMLTEMGRLANVRLINTLQDFLPSALPTTYVQLEAHPFDDVAEGPPPADATIVRGYVVRDDSFIPNDLFDLG